MELIYLHIPEYRGYKNARINFRSDTIIQYDEKRGYYCCKKKASKLPKDFWGINITNLTMIVGNNGAGKTSLMQFIIEMYRDMIYINFESKVKGLLIFEDNGNLYYYASKFYDFSIEWENMEKKRIPEDISIYSNKGVIYQLDKYDARKIFSKTKLIYKTNVLSFEDYQRNKNASKYKQYGKLNYIYDCSVGGILMQDISIDTNLETRKKINTNQLLDSYFTYEQYKQIKFVFDKKQFQILKVMRDKKFPVPVPEKLYVDLLIFNGLNEEWNELYSYNWNSQLGKFIFSYERFWSDSVNTSHILPLALARATVLNAFKSFFRFLYSERLKEKLINRLKEWESNNVNSSESFKKYIDWLWMNVEDIINEEKKYGYNSQAYDTQVHILINIKEYYLDFLNYVLYQNITKYFQYEDIDKWIFWVDNRMLRFSIATSHTEWFMDFIQKYRYICNPDYFLDFEWGLSSGEYNLLSMFSSLYYIFNKDYTNPKRGMYKIINVLDSDHEVCCNSVIIMIDEADLTFHPQWQTQYIAILTEFLTNIFPLECCESIQLLISTHSPILLGDIPSDNVLYLKYDSNKKITEVDVNVDTKTFGQNTYSLFKESFFLNDGAMGQFAKNKINDLIKKIKDLEDSCFTSKATNAKKNMLYEQLIECENLTELIGEPIIRNSLMRKIIRIKTGLDIFSETNINLKDLSDKKLDIMIEQLENERKRRKND